MTVEIQLNKSAHGLNRECLSYGEIIAQSIAVIAPTTTPAANIGLIVAYIWKWHLAEFSNWHDWANVCRYQHRLKKLRPMDILFSVLGVAFMMIPVVVTVGIPGSSMFPVPPAPYNSFPYLFLLYLVAGCGWFFIQRRRYPKMVDKMKRSIEAIHVSYSDSENI